MKPLPHTYRVTLAGETGPYATARIAEAAALRTSPPSAYDGPGDAWSPEHLLVAAVETCFLFTARAVARRMGLPITDIEVNATGSVDRQDGVVRFTEIVLRPTFHVPSAVSRETLQRLVEKAEKGCLVSASLRTPVRIEPAVVAPVLPNTAVQHG